MRRTITKRAVDALEPEPRPIFLWDTDVTGFGVKVTPAGRKVYLFQYRLRGQGGKSAPRRLTLGKHGALTPEQARRLAAQYLLEVRAGGDPATGRASREAATVSELASRFLREYLPAKKRPPRSKTLQDDASIFRCHVVPALGTRRVADVATADLEGLHHSMRQMPYQANRVLAVLHQAPGSAEPRETWAAWAAKTF